MATLLYFGRLGDLTGTAQETLEIPSDIVTAGALRTYLDLRFDTQGALLDPTVRIAVNSEIAFEGSPISDRDEIAFMPPVGGG